MPCSQKSQDVAVDHLMLLSLEEKHCETAKSQSSVDHLILQIAVSSHENASHLIPELLALVQIEQLLRNPHAAPVCSAHGAQPMGARDEVTCCLS